ncbi:hypothetical protein [Mesorhizobium sp.]|uniref:nSTAND3 domain-containing NTPase n=1 Tax=Mesorhizobium sp. TaxID=1871066 RepID=UPI0025DF9DA7|nr:hypothetical protein [Mesorhizobium sp.]
MAYSFTNLSPPEFEDLARDLIGRELEVRFEAFCQGPDGGLDGRHASGGASTILQAKHYAGSAFATLKRAMIRERSSIDRLALDRYILATSRRLSPQNKSALAKIIGPALQSEGDIFSPDDLNTLLRKYPDVDKAHIKLWLSSSAVLDRIIRAATHFFTTMSRAEVEAKVRVYAPNASFKDARDKLEANHVVIISGPPGVGKTTLAEMLSYAYIADNWEFIAIRSLDDGFAAIVDSKKQVFFFDDFLGKVGLDQRALASKDSDIAKFIKRVGATKNARFILTTRAHIFEEARRISEHLGDQRLDITKYSLDVGIYTRQIKARILYNHLYVTELPAPYVGALWDAGAIPRIIDHKNYNPRIIEAMTESVQIQRLSAEVYPQAFINALDNPHDIWDKAFRRHIGPMCQHLLITLFFCSEYGVEADELRAAFSALHPYMCRKYTLPFGAKDFEEALKILEGGFVAIKGGRVSFINPSLRDYLTSYLDDDDLLADMATNAVKADWAASVWKHVKAERKSRSDHKAIIAGNFMSIAEKFTRLPVMRRDPHEPNTYRFYDLAIVNRLELLIEWWFASRDERFPQLCLELARNPADGFSAWREGRTLVHLVRDLRNGSHEGFPVAQELSDELERRVILLLRGPTWPDDIESIYSAIDAADDTLSGEVIEAANEAIVREVDDASDNLSSVDSESTLKDQIAALEKLAPRAGISPVKLAQAIAAIESRMSEIGEATDEAPAPPISGRLPWQADKFDNVALSNLFATLIGDGPVSSAKLLPITSFVDVPF